MIMHFSAAIFAGGRSSRMGSDKAFLQIEGVPLWKCQLQKLQALNPREIFFSGPTRSEWSGTGTNVVADAAENCGPLAGLVGVLRRCESTHLLALAIDLPNMTSAFLRDLLANCPMSGGIIPKRNERFEPLVAIYPRATCLPLAESCLSSGEYSLQTLARRAMEAGLMTAREISDSAEPLFLNLNTPADLAAIAKR